MIEEAAGTSLYEKKREQTTAVIEKKDSKLKEMDSVSNDNARNCSIPPNVIIDFVFIFLLLSQLLKEEVQPRIEKLREEQSQYLEYQKIVRDIDYLTHIHVSFVYLNCQKGVENSEKNITACGAYIENSTQEIEDNKNEIEKIDDECALMQERIDGEAGGSLVDLETELAAKSKAEATANGAKKSATTEVETEKRKLKTLLKNTSKDEDALKEKEAQMANVGGLFQSLKDADEADRKAFADAQKRFQAISAGLDMNEDGEAASLQEQLIGMNACHFIYSF